MTDFNPVNCRKYPSRWPLIRGKELFRVVDNRSETGTEELLTVSHITGITPRSQKNVTMFQAESLAGYKLCEIGDIAANTMWMWQGAIGVSKYAGLISPGYDVYRQKGSHYNPRYLDILLREKHLVDVYHSLSTGIRPSRLRLYPNVFLTIRFPVPPRTEQDQIVRFLDWKVSEVNRLIENYRHHILAFREMEQQVIDESVIKGMKTTKLIYNSDNRWNIRYPEHWHLRRIREFFSFRKGLSITKENLEDTGIPVISYGQIHSKNNSGVKLNKDLIRYINKSYIAENHSCLVDTGDFIFADTSEDIAGCGNCAYIDWNGTIFAGYHTIIAHPNSSTSSKYFAYLFKSSTWRNQIQKKANGVKVYSITQKMLKDTFVLIPPQKEQEQIVSYLDSICNKIANTVRITEKRIKTLQELKTRLIAEAVTGKIDVRNIEIPEYEFVGGESQAEEEIDAEGSENEE